MATWISDNIILTKVGSEILSKVQSGTGAITISRIVTGGGYVSPSQLYNQTAVSNIKQTAQIVKSHTDEEGSILEIQVNNTGLTEAYSLYQIGIYVTHPDYTGEQLYLIAQCNTDSPDTIPLPSVTPVSFNYSFYMEHSGTSSVNITVSTTGYVSIEDYNDYAEAVATEFEAVDTSIDDLQNDIVTGEYLSVSCSDFGTSIPVNVLSSNVKPLLKGNTAYNIVKNGSFDNGTANWLNLTSTDIVSGRASKLVTAQYQGIHQAVTTIVGHKYYISADIEGSAQISLELRGGGFKYNTSASKERVSNIVTASITANYVDVNNGNSSNWATYYVDNVVLIDLTALGLDSLTIAQANAMFPSYFDGMKSIDNITITNVGKNLINISKVVNNATVATQIPNGINITGIYNVNLPVILAKNTTYTMSWIATTVSGTPNLSWRYKYSDGTLSSFGLNGAPLTTESSKIVQYVLLYVAQGTSASADFTNIQLELGTTATAYEPYMATSISTTEVFRRVPNGTVDEKDFAKGKTTKKISDEYTVLSSNISTLVTSYDNVDYITLPMSVLTGMRNYGVADSDGTKIMTTVSAPRKGVAFDVATNVWLHYTTADCLVIIIPKGTYTNLTAAQTALAGTKIIYELATPVITYSTPSDIKALKGGTVQIDSVIMPSSLTFDCATNISAQEKLNLEGVNTSINDVNIPAINLVQNSDFSKGMEGWITQVTGTTASASNKEVTLLAGGAYGKLLSPVMTLVTGHKYYMKADIKSTSANVGLSVSGTPASAVNHSGSGNYEQLSIVWLSTINGNGYIYLADCKSSGFTNIYGKYFMFIDLTTTFGAGKEPTKDQMDYLMSTFPNNHFCNTGNLYNALANLNKLNAVETLANTHESNLTVYATNLQTNGDLANGTTGLVSSNCSMSVSNGELTMLASASSAYILMPACTFVAGHKYYLKVDVKSATGNAPFHISGKASTFLYHSGSNNYERLSEIWVSDITGSGSLRISDGRSSGWNNIYVKNFMAVDLTAIFGDDYEPTLEQFENLLKYLNSNVYFNGTVNIFNAISSQRKLLKDEIVANGNNLLINSDFRLGGASWTPSNANMVSCNDKEFTMLASAQNGRYAQLPYCYASKKYYLAGWIKATSSAVGLLMGGQWAYHSGSGNYEYLSMVVKPSGTDGTYYTGFADTRTSGWSNVSAKYLTFICLTDIFGAGNEPTKDQMDYIMSAFPNKWFYSTANIFNAINTLNKLNEVETIADTHESNLSVYATNLQTNGDVSSTTGLTANSATISASNNELTMLGTGSGAYVNMPACSFISGHKYLIKADVKATTTASSFNVAGKAGTLMYHSGSNTYERLSMIWTSDTTGSISLRLNDSRTSGWNNIYAKYFLVVDLTATYGAGNEPTLEQANFILDCLSNAWFGGTMNEGNMLKIFNRINALISSTNASNRALAIFSNNLMTNADYSLGTAGWSASNCNFVSLTNKELTFLATALNGKYSETVNLTANKKYYAFGWIKSTSSGVGLDVGLGVGYKAHTGSGNYEFLSFIFTPSSTAGFVIGGRDARSSGWDNVSQKNLGLICLTDIFGAGKEPTVDLLDSLVNLYGSSFINGLKNVVEAVNIRGSILPVTNNGVTIESTVYTATISTTWTGSSAPYSQTVTITGLRALDKNVRVDPVFSTDNATRILQQEAWSKINDNSYTDNSITFICSKEKPTTAVPIQVVVGV